MALDTIVDKRNVGRAWHGVSIKLHVENTARSTLGILYTDFGCSPMIPKMDVVVCLIGENAEVTHAHDYVAHGDRPSWTFDPGTRLGIHIPPQKLRLEAAVRMRDERPGNAEHAGIPFPVAQGEFEQSSIKSGRQIVTDFAKLLLNDIKIVNQPFRCRGDCASLLNRAGRRPAILEMVVVILIICAIHILTLARRIELRSGPRRIR
jgi:hypothetical protein